MYITTFCLLALNLAITGFMTGLIWFVQLVHYPIFAKVPPADFPAFHHFHTLQTAQLTAVAMLLELLAALALFAVSWPKWGMWLVLMAFLLLLAIWAATFFHFIPLHGALARQYSPQLVVQLVSGNWWRTWAWTLRLGIYLALWAYLAR
jgi:hypothetical protein